MRRPDLPRPLLVLATGVVSAALLTGCGAGGGSDDGDAPKAERTAAAPSSEPATEPSPTPTPTPGPTEIGTPAELTPEGGELDPTAEAVIQVGWGLDPAGDLYYDAQFASRLVGVRPADPGALAEIDISGYDPATHTAYYVDTVHRVLWARGNSELTDLSAPDIQGWDATGAPGAQLLVFGTFDGCEPGSGPAVVGTEITSCDIIAVPAGQTVGFAGVVGNPQVSQDAHAEITTTPLVWRTS